MITNLRRLLSHVWAFLDRITPQLVAVCLVLGAYGAVASYIQGKANEKLQQRQDAAQAERIADNEARTRDNALLLGCFDRTLSELTGTTLPLVREASAQRNAALTNAIIGNSDQVGLGYLLIRAQRGEQGNRQQNLNRLIETFTAFQKADRHLIAVQKANPYPEPTSQFCKLPD